MSNESPNEKSSNVSASPVPPAETGAPDVHATKSRRSRTKKQLLMLGTFVVAFIATVLCLVLPAVSNEYQIKDLVSSAKNGTNDEKAKSIALLRSLISEELLSSPDFGLLNLNDSQDREVFFKVTGKTKEGRHLTDALYQRTLMGGNIVGPKVKGLCLTSSKIKASMDSVTLTSRIDWTMTFRNRGDSNAEARLEMELPENAVVSQATLWINGKPKEAVVAERDNATAAYQSVVHRSMDPLLITLPSKNRLMVQCFPVLSSGVVMRINIGIRAPLSVESSNGVLHLPRILDSNFLEPKSHTVSVFSKEPIVSSLHEESSRAESGFNIVRKRKKNTDASSTVTYSFPFTENRKTIVVEGPPASGKKRFIVEQLKPLIKPSVSRLYMVIDTSSIMKKHAHLIKSAISSIPESFRPTICFVTEPTPAGKEKVDSVPAKLLNRLEAMVHLTKEEFIGGKNNGPELRDTLERASENPGSVVLWLHGPQPITQALDRYLEFDHAVKLYDFQVDAGQNEILPSLYDEHLDNSLELNVLTPKEEDADAALQKLIGYWKSPSQSDRETLSFSISNQIPRNTTVVRDISIANQVVSLWAGGEVNRLLAKNSPVEAEKLACKHHLVTAVTAAVVLEREEDYKQFSLSSAPEGASFGSINDTYSGMHQWFKDDVVGNLFQNIVQLIGKCLSELIDGWLSDCSQTLTRFIVDSSLYPLGRTPVVSSLVAICCVVQMLVAPIICFLAPKFDKNTKMRIPSGIAAIGKSIMFMFGYALLSGLIIDFSTPVCLFVFQIDLSNLATLDYAIAQACRGGVIAAGAGATSFFAPIMANLAIPVAGQFVGSIFYFSSTLLFTLIMSVLIIEMLLILALLLCRQIMLGMQLLVAPMMFSLAPGELGRNLIRTLLDLVLWTAGWFGVLKILTMIAFSSANPWAKELLIVSTLLSVILLTKKLVLRRICSLPP